MRRLLPLSPLLLCGLLLILSGCLPSAPGNEQVEVPTNATPAIAPTEAAATPTVASTDTVTGTTPLTTPVAAGDPLANTRWQLVSFGAEGNEETPMGETIPTLEFGVDGTVGGSGGCNSFGGTYQVAGNTLTFSQFTSTRMACAAEVMTQEERYLTALAAVTQFEEVRELLRLSSDGGGEILNFTQTMPSATLIGTPTETATATSTITATPDMTTTVIPTDTGSGEVGSCTWAAIHNFQPPGPATLQVSGVCIMPTGGYSLTLTRAEPQGINPAILLLNLVVTAPTGMVTQVLTPVEVMYTEETDQHFDQVTILVEGDLPTGATVDVEEVQ